MGRQGRLKGNAFERRVSKVIVAVAGEGYSKERCYRTPLSGGHAQYGEGDIQMTKKLGRAFPFAIECKHYKHWHTGHLFKFTKQLRDFLEQAEEGSRKALARFNKIRYPLLVVSGNGTGIYCVFPVLLMREGLRIKPPILKMRHGWAAANFENFLRSWFSQCGI